MSKYAPLVATSFALAFVLTAAPLLAAEAIYVSPTGNDAQAGTPAEPVATLATALERARVGGAKRIVMDEGRYFDVGVTLGPADSHVTIEAAEGKRPRLYGGVPLTGWKPDGERFFAAELPAGRQWDVRLLVVEGKMRPRARLPEQDTLVHLNSFDVPWMSSTGGGWKRKPTEEELSTLTYKEGDLGDWLDVRGAEVTVQHMWDESVVGVTSHDAAARTLKLAPLPGHPPGAFGVKKYIVWNVRQGMTRPGQWYFDRTGNRIVYWPMPGEDMSRIDAVVPTQTTIIRLAGSKQKPVQGVVLRGLTLSCTTVPLVAGGFAAARFDGAVSLGETRDCRLEGLTIESVAGQGIAAGNVAGTVVERCHVTECGAGGIYVGGQQAVIRHNRVHGVGRMFPSGIGIYRGGRGCTVSHNEVHDCSYSAINYGGQENVIEGNLIYDCMTVLHDGAAIYLFAAKDCIIRGNLARDIIDRGGYGASSYYLDERSTGCVVERNVSLGVVRPSHNHMAVGNTIRQNVFVSDGDLKITFPRSSEFTVEQNIVVAKGEISVTNPTAVTQWSKNVFFSAAGRVRGVALKDYREGEDVQEFGDTLFADPKLADPAKLDLRFGEGSPAMRLGIPVLDVSKAGRKTD
jgi:hypothetical protein